MVFLKLLKEKACMVVLALLVTAFCAVPQVQVFEALQGVQATPMTAAEMDSVQGKNWWTTGYTWHTIAAPALNETTTTSTGSVLTVVIGPGGGSATVSTRTDTYFYTAN